MEKSSDLTISEVILKNRSKKEVYIVLSVEGGIYLPPISDASQKFLKGILTGKKKYFINKGILVKRVPQIDNLRVKELISFAKQNIEIESYLSDYDYYKVPQREWLCNIINTLIPEKFDEFVSWGFHKRENKLINQKGLKVNVLSQFVDIFSQSKNVSIFNGRSHFLLRDPPRKDKSLRHGNW